VGRPAETPRQPLEEVREHPRFVCAPRPAPREYESDARPLPDRHACRVYARCGFL
jgi:hypothetical protein